MPNGHHQGIILQVTFMLNVNLKSCFFSAFSLANPTPLPLPAPPKNYIQNIGHIPLQKFSSQARKLHNN